MIKYQTISRTALLFWVTVRLLSCHASPPCGEFPALPYEGTYHLSEPERSPVDITSVEVACTEMTFYWQDADGVAQFVTYTIDPSD